MRYIWLLFFTFSLFAKPQLAILAESDDDNWSQVEIPMKKLIDGEIKNPKSSLNKFDYTILEIHKETDLVQKLEQLREKGCTIFIGFSLINEATFRISERFFFLKRKIVLMNFSKAFSFLFFHNKNFFKFFFSPKQKNPGNEY